MSVLANKFKVGILLPMSDLYNRLWGQKFVEELNAFIKDAVATIDLDSFEFIISPSVSTRDAITAQCEKFNRDGVGMIVVALAPYCSSGVLAPGLIASDLPLLLWPAQTIYELISKKSNEVDIKLSHGVHAVQDLANILRKRNKAFGVLHGHYLQGDFKDRFKSWVMAAKAVSGLKKSNPIQLGGHFEDMLDLQVGHESFIKDMEIKLTEISSDEFISARNLSSSEEVSQFVSVYKKNFVIADNINDDLLDKTAQGEIALRFLMNKYQSKACGINFLELCNNPNISDALHVAASRLMAQGKGYAAEGDWVTASFVYALQQAFGQASFSEIFSVGYKYGNLLLRHWGEGNPMMARGRAKINSSEFKDQNLAEFAVVDFEFAPGSATLVNINSTPLGTGQLISISGNIIEDQLDQYTSPRAVFRPSKSEVREVLDTYAYNGGSHHLTLVNGDVCEVIDNISKLLGWKYLEI